MAILALHPNNKNQYRRYPLKQESTCVADDGYQLLDTAVVNCSVTATYGRHRIYIKQLVVTAASVRLTIAAVLNDEVLGVFVGDNKDLTTLQLQAFVPHVSGNLTIGTVPALGVHSFQPGATELEESTIFLYTPPGVTSLRDPRDRTLVGNVKLGLLTNLTKEWAGTTLKLKASNPAAVFNQADKSTYLGNCPTPTILAINEITPYPIGTANPANDGNIYLVGVKPIVFSGIPDETDVEPGVVAIDTGSLTLDTLCTQRHKLLPPIHVEGFTQSSSEFKDLYYSRPALSAYPGGSANYPLTRPARAASNFNATEVPEYYYWPQLVQPSFYENWPTP